MSEVSALVSTSMPPARPPAGQPPARGDSFARILDGRGRDLPADAQSEAGDETEEAAEAQDGTFAPDGAARPERPVRRIDDIMALGLVLGAAIPSPEPEPGGEDGPLAVGDGEAETPPEDDIPVPPLVIAPVPAEPLRSRASAPAGSGEAGEARNASAARGEALAAAIDDAVAAADMAGDGAGEGDPDGGKGRGAGGEQGGARAGAPQDPLAVRVSVMAETAAIAGAAPASSRTVANLAAAIASDGEWSASARDARAVAEAGEAAASGPVRDLKIQLSPASLGEVNARLRLHGDQLMVELRVDSSEAFQRLSSDRDAIVASLRGLGFSVDEVTIVQQPAGAGAGQGATAGRDGGAGSFGAPGSERQQGGQGAAGRDGRGSEGFGRQGQDAEARGGGADTGGVYI